MDKSHADTYLRQLEHCRNSLRNLLPRIYEPDDVFQEVVLVIHESPGPDNPSAAPCWLRSIARNIAVRWHRRELVRHCLPIAPDSAALPPTVPNRQLEHCECRQRVREAVATLGPKYREVIERRFFRDQSFGEIARDLAVPEQTVRTRYKRAIKRLRADPTIRALA